MDSVSNIDFAFPGIDRKSRMYSFESMDKYHTSLANKELM